MVAAVVRGGRGFRVHRVSPSFSLTSLGMCAMGRIFLIAFRLVVGSMLEGLVK